MALPSAVDGAIHVRRADQLAVEAVDPRVVRARDARLVAASVEQRRAAVNAHVVEGAQSPVVIAQHDDRSVAAGLCRVG